MLLLRKNYLLEYNFPVSFGKVVNLPGTSMALPDKIPHDFTKHLASVVCNYIALFSSHWPPSSTASDMNSRREQAAQYCVKRKSRSWKLNVKSLSGQMETLESGSAYNLGEKHCTETERCQPCCLFISLLMYGWGKMPSQSLIFWILLWNYTYI